MTDESLPLIIDPADLAIRLDSPALDSSIPDSPIRDEHLLLIAVVQQQVFLSQHIPGSVLIEPSELVCGIKPAVGKLPGVEQLSQLFSRIGLSEDKHVIAYDDEGGGWAGRLLWTLDVLGHKNYSYLDGGLIAWLKSGLPLASGDEQHAATDYQASIDSQYIADIDEVLGTLDDADTIIWDARSPEEYAGTKITSPRNGHIPGAVNLDWLELMDRDNDLRLKPLAQINTRLEQLGITEGKQIITHCQTHHRSGLSYLVGKALGLNIKAYDGSWSEWGNRSDTPVQT